MFRAHSNGFLDNGRADSEALQALIEHNLFPVSFAMMDERVSLKLLPVYCCRELCCHTYPLSQDIC